MTHSSDQMTLVLLGAAPPAANVVAGRTFDQVIGVDRGIDYALSMGLDIDVGIGDFDSVSAEGLAAAEASGARIYRHPIRKDATDLELGLDEAVRLGAEHILVVGSYDTTRLDHQIANLLLLAHEKYATIQVEAIIDTARIHVVHGSTEVSADLGELATLLALHGAANGVSTTGLEYELADETLLSASSRGVSNVVSAEIVGVEVTSGVVLLIFPGERQ